MRLSDFVVSGMLLLVCAHSDEHLIRTKSEIRIPKSEIEILCCDKKRAPL
jgi:hypothetical protein